MKFIKIQIILGLLLYLTVSGCAPGKEDTYSERQRELISDVGKPAGADISYAETAEGSDNEGMVKAGSKPLTEESELSDYLAYAALNNPGLEAAFYRWKAALAVIPQAESLPDPRFNYKYFIEEVETRSGPQRQSFELSQVFPWFGKLDLRGDVAGQAAMALKERYESVKLELFQEVKDVYYEYFYLSKAISITQENIKLLRHMENVARSRYKAAAGSHPDVIRAQVEVGKLEDRYQALVDLKEPVIARLNAALNRPVNAEIPAPAEIELDDVDFDDQRAIARLMESNPELEALDHEIVQNQKKIELAKKDYYPDFNIGVGVIDTGDSPVDNSDSGKDPVIASVSINLPIWHEKYAAGERQARRNYYAARRVYKEQANTLSAKLKMALYNFRDAERKIDLYKNALLPKAKESLKVTESGYRSAGGSFTDLVDAQRILLEFSLSYERSLANRQQALARIEKLVGGELPGSGSEKN